MAKKPTRSKKVKACPPAIAKGITTTAEVKPMKRPRGQGPRKIKKGPIPKKRKSRVKKWVDEDVDKKPKRPNHLPWTTKSRRILNEQKDLMRFRKLRRKRLSPATKKRLEAVNKRRIKRILSRLHDLFNTD